MKKNLLKISTLFFALTLINSSCKKESLQSDEAQYQNEVNSVQGGLIGQQSSPGPICSVSNIDYSGNQGHVKIPTDSGIVVCYGPLNTGTLPSGNISIPSDSGIVVCYGPLKTPPLDVTQVIIPNSPNGWIPKDTCYAKPPGKELPYTKGPTKTN